MNFLTKAFRKVTAGKKYTEEQAKKILKENPNTKYGEFDDLVEPITDVKFLKELYRKILHNPSEDSSLEHFNRREVVKRVINLSPKDTAFFVEVMK